MKAERWGASGAGEHSTVNGIHASRIGDFASAGGSSNLIINAGVTSGSLWGTNGYRGEIALQRRLLAEFFGRAQFVAAVSRLRSNLVDELFG